MSIYSRSQWTDEEADKLAAEKYVHDMERAHPFPEGCKSDYLAGCTHIRSTVVAPLGAKLAEAQLRASVLTDESLQKFLSCEAQLTEAQAETKRLIASNNTRVEINTYLAREIDRLRNHLEMILPECSCYRSMGMCERCRILDLPNDQAALAEGKEEK